MASDPALLQGLIDIKVRMSGARRFRRISGDNAIETRRMLAPRPGLGGIPQGREGSIVIYIFPHSARHHYYILPPSSESGSRPKS
jgi:hypothetical protein